MKIVREWLEELLDVSSFSDEEIASALTKAGTEVGSYAPLSTASGIVVGKILTCEKVADSDHLHLLSVDVGEEKPRQIVCGAPNARAGLVTAVALPGAKLPGGKTIKSGAVHGILSDGMCCSTLELGLEEKYADDCDLTGIHEFDPSSVKIGEDAVKALGLDSTVFDLEVLSNRGDLLSYEGVARELSSDLGLPYEEKEAAAPEGKEPLVLPASTTEKCCSFLLITAEGLKNKESPAWLRSRLVASGIRPIDAIVDIGNYAMLLTGQPLNMYDLDALKGSDLTAVDDYEGKFVTMDGKERELVRGDVVISSGGVPACLAGIMTSLEASVGPKTTRVAVEAASFAGADIRRTSLRLGLASESSLRFSKGIDPAVSRRTLAIVAALLKSICEAAEVSKVACYGAKEEKKVEIPFSIERINARLGTSFSSERIIEALKRDHLLIKEENGSLVAVVPSYRKDLLEEADLSEEAIRLIGIEEIKSVLPHTVLPYAPGRSLQKKKQDAVRRYLTHLGLDETITYSLVSPKLAAYEVLLPKKEDVKPVNPLTVDHSIMRQDVLPSLLQVASYNAAHGENDLSFFETSKVYGEGYSDLRLSIVLTGKRPGQGMIASRDWSFYDLKGYLEGILFLLGINEQRVRLAALSDHPLFHPGRSAYLALGKERIAVFGELHPSLVRAFALPKPALGLELDLGALLALKGNAAKAAVPPSFPSVRRDLSIVYEKEVVSSEAVTAIKRSSSFIERVEPFDVYEGEDGKRVAYALFLRKKDGTLVEGEIEEAVKKALAALERLGGKLRV